MLISINGPDNVGKTTQICFLELNNLGSLDKYSNDIQNAKKQNFTNWWFYECETYKFTKIIFNAIIKRYNNYKKDNNIYTIDRGVNMFISVCIATSMIKDNISFNEAKDKIYKIYNEMKIPEEDVSILLVHGNNIKESIEISLRREKLPITDLYKRYQEILQNIILTEKSNYSKIINCTNKSIIDIQNEIRTFIGIKLMFCNVNIVLGLAGLSESGKSTCGDYFSNNNFIRLKIGYLTNNHDNEDEYSHEIVKGLNRFSNSHYYYNNYTIESMHRYNSVKYLKIIMGNKFKIIYIDTYKENRYLRTNEIERNLIEEKDIIKINRGANIIKNISDYVINNNYSLKILYQELNNILIDYVKDK